MLQLTLYSRSECCLCDEMKVVLSQVRQEFPFELEEIDISCSTELEARFGQEIPVLFVNGHKAFKYRLTARELRRRLAREGVSS
jgi:glutaredoxin